MPRSLRRDERETRDLLLTSSDAEPQRAMSAIQNSRRDMQSDQDILRDIFTTTSSSNVALLDSTEHSTTDYSSNNRSIEGELTKASNITEEGMLNLWENGQEQKKNIVYSDVFGTEQSPFTSRLGRRIWEQYQGQQPQLLLENQHPSQGLDIHLELLSAQLSLLPLPTMFLQLPPSIIRVRCLPPSNRYEWATITELECRVMQQHRDIASEDGTHNHHSSLSSSSTIPTYKFFTRRMERDPNLGLGMTLRVWDGCTYIYELLRHDGYELVLEEEENEDRNRNEYDGGGPATTTAGLLTGDRLMGLNGQPFLKGRLATDTAIFQTNNHGRGVELPQAHLPSDEILKSIRDLVQTSLSPMALHIQRLPPTERIRIRSLLVHESRDQLNMPSNIIARHDAPKIIPQTIPDTLLRQQPKGSPIIHPFAKALSKRNIITKGHEEQVVTRKLRIFTDRTRQWESKLSFRLRASDYALRPVLDLRDVEHSYYASFLTDEDDTACPPYFDYKFSKCVRPYAPSTPLIRDWRLSHPDGGGHSRLSPPMRISQKFPKEATIIADLYAGLDDNDVDVQEILLGDRRTVVPASGGKAACPTSMPPQAMYYDKTDIFVPLVGVRKAFSVRLLNSFLDNRNRTAFTIWCYDVESGKEWYAPVRYYSDFKDLRTALIRIDKTITDIPFPSLGWSLSFTNEAKESEKTKDARRNQLEMFLRRVFAGIYRGRLHPDLAEIAVHLQTFVGCDTALGEEGEFSLSKQVAISEMSYGKRTPDPKSELDSNARMHLKRSIMRYVYRIFLLPSVEELVSQFIDAAREKGMSEVVVPARRQLRQVRANKVEASNVVEKIRDFIDQVQELVLEGCRDDLLSMSERRDFLALVDNKDNSIREEIFREAIREQTELEIYVPLRSTISKYLVYAWFNEDIEMKHKMKAVIDKPQSYFRIPKEQRSRSDWKSVSRILGEGVGRSTLPCVKLRAVVDAAKEISQLEGEERSLYPDSTFFDGTVVTKVKALGADDFLPIFIFSFVRAKIERPYALCELLSLMCDPSKSNGEIGYYLATFHAALTHIHELDLTEAENDPSLVFDN